MTRSTDRRETIVSRDFLLVALASLLYFLAFAATSPVLPRFVRFELGRSTAIVGLVAGSSALGALAIRPLLGRIAARRGTRMLVVVGAALAGVGLAGHVLVHSIGPLFPMRILMGVGQAAFLVGCTTLAMELAPRERRGEATAYVLVGAQIGLALGPLLGESILHASSYNAVWLTSAAAMGVSVVVSCFIRQGPVSSAGAHPVRWFHPAAIGPGAVLGIGQLGFIGFNTFVPLYARDLGLSGVAPVFLLMSGIIIVVRSLGARLPDRMGPAAGATIALSMTALGLLTVGAWRDPSGLYAGTVGIAIGSAFLFPSLAAAATTGVSDRDRASAVATFTLFLDLSIGLAPVLNGALAAALDYRAMFLIAACYSMIAMALLYGLVRPRMRRTSESLPAATAPSASEGPITT